jgi:hypothetical protein
MAAQPSVRKIPFAFYSANFTTAIQPARSWAIKRTIAAGGTDNPDPSTFAYDPGMAKTVNGTLTLFHKNAVTTGDIKIGVAEVNDNTIAVPFTNSTLVLSGWNLDLRLFNTDAAAQTYVAMFAPNGQALLDASYCKATWDMSGTGLLVRQNDNIVFREISLVFFKATSYTNLPGEVVLNLQTGDLSGLTYPLIATRRLHGSRADVDWSEANNSGQNPLAVYSMESPLFLRGSDSKVGVIQAGNAWFPFMNAYFRCVGPSPYTLSYLFHAVGELYQGGNTTRGFQGG